MLYFFLPIFFWLFTFFNPLYAINSAVTYELLNTRFGDQVLSYLHAKWISYKFNIPVLYKEFKYSNQLKLHTLEEKYNRENSGKYRNQIQFTKDNMPTNVCDNTLYTVPYFGEPIEDHVRFKNWIYFDVDWKDPGFFSLIKNYVAPIQQLKLIEIPQNVISIALHVRTGVGFDGPILAEVFPFKCPPLEFYVNALNHMIVLLKNKPLYVFIFTDHPNPQEIAHFFKKNISYEKITWNYRSGRGNRFYDQDVLEDFFSIACFDCLIRSESHFSFCASKLAHYVIEISPKTFYVSDEIQVITS